MPCSLRTPFLIDVHLKRFLDAFAALPFLLSVLSFSAVALLTGCGSSGTKTVTPPTPTAPAIATQPGNQSAFVGATANFSVIATGTAPLTYAWQLNGKAIAGASSSSFTTPALTLADNGDSFTVVVSNLAGTVTSNAAKLTVSVQAPTITTQPSNVKVTIGQTANFSVTATGTAPLGYQWLRNSAAIAGATASTYSLANAQLTDSGANLTVTVSNSAGNVTSNAATLTVDDAPATITKQPADVTAFVGETATFSVSATGTNLTYQWRKDAGAIAGATSASYTTPMLVTGDDKAIYDVVVGNSAGSGTSAPATLHVGPFATKYKDINGATIDLYAWPGAKNAIQSKSNTLSPAGMRRFLNIADAIYGYYANATGKTPTLFVNYNGLATISQVPSTCGAGCTYIGATGMEFLDSYFDSIYAEASENYVDQALAYEFGRSFWLMGSQLEFKSPDTSGCVVTGYAVLMRYEAIAGLKYTGYSGSVDGYNQALADTKTLVDLYQADSSQTWDNTTKVDHFTLKPGYGCADLFASQMMRLGDSYGGQQKFINALWKASQDRLPAVVTQDAVDNLILSACAAANLNLTTTFVTKWRWPMSTAAQNEATSKYGPPD